MAELILARHGETDWNKSEVFRGRADVKLNQTGVRQAELLADYLANLEIDAIYSSPLARALKTATIIAKRKGLQVNITAGLIDFDYGKWQGLSHQEVKNFELYAQWLSHPERVKMPDGESLEDVRQRTLGVINDVLGRRHKRAVLVSHRVVNKVLICALLGLDVSRFWNIKHDTGAITVFTHENGCFVLTRHNDTCYLKQALSGMSTDF